MQKAMKWKEIIGRENKQTVDENEASVTELTGKFQRYFKKSREYAWLEMENGETGKSQR